MSENNEHDESDENYQAGVDQCPGCGEIHPPPVTGTDPSAVVRRFMTDANGDEYISVADLRVVMATLLNAQHEHPELVYQPGGHRAHHRRVRARRGSRRVADVIKKIATTVAAAVLVPFVAIPATMFWIMGRMFGGAPEPLYQFIWWYAVGTVKNPGQLLP
jgi:hypothetical protein